MKVNDNWIPKDCGEENMNNKKVDPFELERLMIPKRNNLGSVSIRNHSHR